MALDRKLITRSFVFFQRKKPLEFLLQTIFYNDDLFVLLDSDSVSTNYEMNDLWS